MSILIFRGQLLLKSVEIGWSLLGLGLREVCLSTWSPPGHLHGLHLRLHLGAGSDPFAFEALLPALAAALEPRRSPAMKLHSLTGGCYRGTSHGTSHGTSSKLETSQTNHLTNHFELSEL